MGPFGFWEILIVLGVLLLLFGARRLPEMGRSLGRGMREFKDAVTGVTVDEPKPEEQGELTTRTPAPGTHGSPSGTQGSQSESERVTR